LVIFLYLIKNGQLGTKDFEDRSLPTKLEALNNIIDISSGATFSLVLNNKGEVYSFGSNGVLYKNIKKREDNLELVKLKIKTNPCSLKLFQILKKYLLEQHSVLHWI
jgi:alpha-tubulin suppressor-like RCC1 family protein